MGWVTHYSELDTKKKKNSESVKNTQYRNKIKRKYQWSQKR